MISENQRLCQENGILGQYIENLMKESPIFSPAGRRTNNGNSKTVNSDQTVKTSIDSKNSNASNVHEDEDDLAS